MYTIYSFEWCRTLIYIYIYIYFFKQTHLPTEIYRIVMQLYHICSFFLLLFSPFIHGLLFYYLHNDYGARKIIRFLKSSNQIRIHHYLFSKKQKKRRKKSIYKWGMWNCEVVLPSSEHHWFKAALNVFVGPKLAYLYDSIRS